MSIPETQLETWSHQGSVTQSAATYNTIRNVLLRTDTPFHNKSVSVFLQGSYGNDTNIYAESDVDIVIKLDDCWHSDLTALPDDQKTAYQNTYPNATYCHNHFKQDVLRALKGEYGSAVDPGNKAISIAAGGGRRKADLIVAVQYRRYYKFRGAYDQRYDEGICFFDAPGTRIANYPKQHSDNLTVKHQSCSSWWKPMARVLKNMRSTMIERGLIAARIAPSYYLEGLLYNVPNAKFVNSYTDCFVGAINWILEADRSQFVCANEQYYLLRDGSPVTWRASDCDQFLGEIVKLWKEW